MREIWKRSKHKKQKKSRRAVEGGEAKIRRDGVIYYCGDGALRMEPCDGSQRESKKVECFRATICPDRQIEPIGQGTVVEIPRISGRRRRWREEKKEENRSVGNGGAESDGIRDTVMLHRRPTGQLATVLSRYRLLFRLLGYSVGL